MDQTRETTKLLRHLGALMLLCRQASRRTARQTVVRLRAFIEANERGDGDLLDGMIDPCLTDNELAQAVVDFLANRLGLDMIDD